MRGSLAFIYGGRGLEREVSVLGADFLLPILQKSEYGCIPVYIAEDGRWFVCRRGDEFLRPDIYGLEECAGLINLGGRGGLCLGGEVVMLDCAFPLLHGDFGEDGSVQGALETCAVPFVGEDVFVSALCLDKAACRAFASGLSVNGAKWIAPPSGTDIHKIVSDAEKDIGYPMFVKPRSLGSSIGAGVANNREELISAYMIASQSLTRHAIIEEMVDIDCELEIGVLQRKGKYIFTKIGKIKNNSGFYSYDEKYSEVSDAEVDSTYAADPLIEKDIIQKASKLASALELRSLARMDFFLNKKGEIYFNEINTMPGFTAGSLFWKLFSEMGISPSELVEILIAEAMS